MNDVIWREDAVDAVASAIWHYPNELYKNLNVYDAARSLAIDAINTLPSAESREYGVLCALADRECPFQGKEVAWCLTCPHISEEDRELVRKAVEGSQPKTGQWKLVDHMWQCDQCQYRQNEKSPTNFCPSCGAKMRGEEE